MDRSRSRTAPRPLAFSSAARQSPWPARTARRWIVRRAHAGRSGWQGRSWTSRKLSPGPRKLAFSPRNAKWRQAIVIPGWCVSTRPGISRFRARCFASPRNDGSPKLLKRAHRKIAQPQIGVAAFFPEPEQRPVQRLAQQIIALAHGDADAFAEIAALDKRAARERAAFGRISAVDPERQRDRIAEDEVDLAAP